MVYRPLTSAVLLILLCMSTFLEVSILPTPVSQGETGHAALISLNGPSPHVPYNKSIYWESMEHIRRAELLDVRSFSGEPQELKPLSSSPNDWIVTGEEAHEDEVIILTGNLIVQAGGSLTLINCTLLMNCTYDKVWGIFVKRSGILNVLGGSNITAYNPEYGFLFHVYGRLIMHDSFLSGCKGVELYTIESVKLCNTTISNRLYGVYCGGSSSITIINCTISSNEWDGIHCHWSSDISIIGCTISSNQNGIICRKSSGVNIIGCTISDNFKGIYCYWSSNISIVNCTVSSNWWSIDCRGSSNINIIGCTISDNTLDGVYLAGSHGISIINCTISDNGWGMYHDGIRCDRSSNISVINCTINNNGYGIHCLESSDISITGCAISINFKGIYCDRSSNITVHYCDIYSNRAHGLYNYGKYVVNASYCWWGSSDGPEYKKRGDPDDPEEVYSYHGLEYLLCWPWLKKPYRLAELSEPQPTPPPPGVVLAPNYGALILSLIHI